MFAGLPSVLSAAGAIDRRQRGRRSAFGRAAPALRRLPENRRCGRKGAGRGNTGCRVLSLVDCVQQRKPQIFQQCVGELIVFLLHPFCLRHIGGRVVPRPHSAENIGDICPPGTDENARAAAPKGFARIPGPELRHGRPEYAGRKKMCGQRNRRIRACAQNLVYRTTPFGIRRCCLQRRGCPRAGRPRPAR